MIYLTIAIITGITTRDILAGLAWAFFALMLWIIFMTGFYFFYALSALFIIVGMAAVIWGWVTGKSNLAKEDGGNGSSGTA